MAGRRPVPDAIKILTGSHNALNPDSPVYRNVKGVKPLKVVVRDPVAMEEWDRVLPELVGNGLLTRASLAYFGAYCMAYAAWQHAEDEVSDNGRILVADVFDKKGEVIGSKQYPNPAIAQAQSAMQLMLRIGVEFGLTPAAATRVKAIPSEDHKRSFNEFLEQEEPKVESESLN